LLSRLAIHMYIYCVLFYRFRIQSRSITLLCFVSHTHEHHDATTHATHSQGSLEKGGKEVDAVGYYEALYSYSD
jgi:hypothetical protein